MTIPRIRVDEVRIPNIYVPDWMNHQPVVDHLVPPVVLNIGNPIVNMPGCVKMHRDNRYHNNGLPIDRNLVENDPDQAMTVCDAEVPSYDAMNFEPEQLIITRETPPPAVEPPPAPPDFKADEIPETKEEVSCPGPSQLRVGDLTQSGDERVIGHRLLEDGKTCETLYEATTAVEKFLPPPNQAATVTALAVVATAGAAATPLLIRIIRPAIKKAWTTVQKKLGKEIRQLSKSEIITNKYREKKGLPPLKRK
tara:strand:- start:1050 stop:1805 length:756 start_codon:yes stop_codon:yes gene_type:complete